jgi:ribosomal protein S18 acetylase RimI-like enzyme
VIRNATEQDIARITEIRNSVRENGLSDPSRVTIEEVRWFIANPGLFVWEEHAHIRGFSAADPRTGNIWALFVDNAQQGRGIGRALLDQACSLLKEAGFDRIWLTTAPGTRAERVYREAGWQAVGKKDNEVLFEMTL